MFRISLSHLRLELLEERSLLASSIHPVNVQVVQLQSMASHQVDANNHADATGIPANDTSAAAESASDGHRSNGTSEASEYLNGADDDERHERSSGASESGDEYKTTGNALTSLRFENPYFYNNTHYEVVPIPPPPAPGATSRIMAGAAAPEPQTDTHPEATG